jgi:site-specific DNA-cytosine methylase
MSDTLDFSAAIAAAPLASSPDGLPQPVQPVPGTPGAPPAAGNGGAWDLLNENPDELGADLRRTYFKVKAAKAIRDEEAAQAAAAPPPPTVPAAPAKLDFSAAIGEAPLQAQVDLDARKKDEARQAELLTWRVANEKRAPEEQAEIMRLSVALDWHPEVVAGDLPGARNKALAAKLDTATVVRDHPALAELLGDPNTTALVRGDTARLTGLSWLLGDWELDPTAPAKGGTLLRQNAPGVVEAMLRQRSLARENHGLLLQLMAAGSMKDALASKPLNPSDIPVPEGMDPETAQAYREAKMARARPMAASGIRPESLYAGQAQKDPAELEAIRARIRANDLELSGLRNGGDGIDELSWYNPAKYLLKTARVLTDMGPEMAKGAVATALPIPGAAEAFWMQEVTPGIYWTLSELKDPATGLPVLTDEEARGYAATAGLPTALSFTASLGSMGLAGKGWLTSKPLVEKALAKLLPASVEKLLSSQAAWASVGRAAYSYGTHQLQGGVMMGVQSAITAATVEAAKASHGQEADAGAIAAAVEEGFVTGMKDFVLIAGWGPMRQYFGERGRISASHERAQVILDINQNTRESKFAKTDPEGFEKYVAKVGKGKTFYVEREAIAELAQKNKLPAREVAAGIMGDKGEAWDRAEEQKTPLAIPAEKWATKVVIPEHDKVLTEHTRMSLEDATPAQLREQMKGIVRRIEEARVLRGATFEEEVRDLNAKLEGAARASGIKQEQAQSWASTVSQYVATMSLYLDKPVRETMVRVGLPSLHLSGRNVVTGESLAAYRERTGAPKKAPAGELAKTGEAVRPAPEAVKAEAPAAVALPELEAPAPAPEPRRAPAPELARELGDLDPGMQKAVLANLHKELGVTAEEANLIGQRNVRAEAEVDRLWGEHLASERKDWETQGFAPESLDEDGVYDDFVARLRDQRPDLFEEHWGRTANPFGVRGYFMSGSNQPGEIRALADQGQHIGVAAPDLSKNAISELKKLKGRDVKVFVDSGAFSEVEFGATGPVVAKPISPAEWGKRLAKYKELAQELGDQLYVVAPDMVAHQGPTLERLTTYAAEMRELKKLGANVIIPLQQGELPPAAFLAKAQEVLGFKDVIAGIPSMKDAMPLEVIRTFATEAKPERVHLLGIGPRALGGRFGIIVDAIATASPKTQVFADSAYLVSLKVSGRAFTERKNELRARGVESGRDLTELTTSTTVADLQAGAPPVKGQKGGESAGSKATLRELAWDNIEKKAKAGDAEAQKRLARINELSDQAYKKRGPEGDAILAERNRLLAGDEWVGAAELRDAIAESNLAGAISVEQAKELKARVAEALGEEGGKATDEVLPPPGAREGEMAQLQNTASWLKDAEAWMRTQGHHEADIQARLGGMEGQLKLLRVLNLGTLNLRDGALMDAVAAEAGLPRGAGLKNPGKNLGGPLRANQDAIYIHTVDFSAQCVKRLGMAATASHLEKLTNQALGPEERIALTALYREAGLMAACLYCYVEAPRAKASEFLNNGLRAVFEREAPLPEGWKGETLELVKKARAEADGSGIEPGEFSVVGYMDPELEQGGEHKGQAELNPAIHELMLAMRGAAKPNLPKLYEEYVSQVLKLKPEEVQQLNDFAGLRIFSSSDFQSEHIVDVVQLVTHMELIGLKSHAYTKVADFALMAGGTGTKIGTSVFALAAGRVEERDGHMVVLQGAGKGATEVELKRFKGTGEAAKKRAFDWLDEHEPEGGFAQDTFQGMDWQDAQYLSARFDDVGGMFVSTSSAQTRWAMKQPWIHQIIPYHASGLPAEYARASGWKDFSRIQSEHWKVKPADEVTEVGAVHKLTVDGKEAGTYPTASAANAEVKRIRAERKAAGQPKPKVALESTPGEVRVVRDGVELGRFASKGEAKEAMDPPKVRMHELGLAEGEAAGGGALAAVERYVALVEARGLTPVFEKFMRNEDGSLNPDFLKLKKDYARTDSPFRTVKASGLDMAHADRLLAAWMADPKRGKAEPNMEMAEKLLALMEHRKVQGKDAAGEWKVPIGREALVHQQANSDIVSGVKSGRVEVGSAKRPAKPDPRISEPQVVAFLGDARGGRIEVSRPAGVPPRVAAEGELAQAPRAARFQKAAFDAVRAVLKPELLKADRRAQYEGQSRFAGHCAGATDALSDLLGGRANGWTHMVIKREFLGGADTHHFLKNELTGEVVDPTAEQFEGGVIPYEKATRYGMPRSSKHTGPTKLSQGILSEVARNRVLGQVIRGRARELLRASGALELEGELAQEARALPVRGGSGPNGEMVVLSLFDGLGGARVALKKLGADVKYYRSELTGSEPFIKGEDRRFLRETNKIHASNFPDSVNLGDVRGVKSGSVPHQVDLLVGGSPCQDLSPLAAVRKGGRKGLEGGKSSLFWEYVRVVKETKPKDILFENVGKMADVDRDIITEALSEALGRKVEPVRLDAADFSSMRRDRYFWTTIPVAERAKLDIPSFGDILDKQPDPSLYLSKTAEAMLDRPAKDGRTHGERHTIVAGKPGDPHYERATTITKNFHKGVPNNSLVDSTGRRRFISQGEAERAFGLPEGTTREASYRAALHAMGNGFSVPVVEHILKGAFTSEEGFLDQASLEGVAIKEEGGVLTLKNPETNLYLLSTVKPGTRMMEASLLGLDRSGPAGSSSYERAVAAEKGKGYSSAYYLRLLVEARARGYGVESDVSRTPATERMYKRLGELGIPFEKRVDPGTDLSRWVLDAEVLGTIDLEGAWRDLQAKTRASLGELRQQKRGTIRFRLGPTGRPVDFDISALRGDASTLAHETGHWLSWSLHEVAMDRGVPEGVRADYARLLKFAGFESPEAREAENAERTMLSKKKSRTTEEDARIEQLSAKEERISHAWEQYLAEGKAPSGELKPAFSRFRRWMTEVYGNIDAIKSQYRENYKQELELSDEVRGVFDRMLAVDKVIDEQRTEVESFDYSTVLNLTPSDQAKLAELRVKRQEEARDRLDSKVVKDDGRSARGELGAERERIELEVEQELRATPVYLATEFLDSGSLRNPDTGRLYTLKELPDALKDGQGKALKLNVRDVAVLLGEAEAAKMVKAGRAVKEGGVNPDELAPLLGFDSGEAMVRAVAFTLPVERAIANEATKRFEQTYGPALAKDTEALSQHGRDAMHNPADIEEALHVRDVIARELGTPAEKGGKLPHKILKANVRRIIEGTRLEELSAKTYLVSEREGAKRAHELLAEAARAAKNGKVEEAKGLYTEALHEWDAVVLAKMLWERADAITKEMDRTEVKMKRLELVASSANLGKASIGYSDAVDAVLKATGFRDGRGRGGAIDAALASMKEDGGEVVVGANGRLEAALWDSEAIRELVDQPRAWEYLTVAEARNVADAMENIRVTATRKNKVRVGEKVMDRQDLFDATSLSLAKTFPGEARDPKALALWGKLKEGGRRILSSVDANLTEMEAIAERLAGGDRNHPVWKLLVEERLKCRDRELELSAQFVDRIETIWNVLPEKMRKSMGDVIEGLEVELPMPDTGGIINPKSKMTRSQLWMIALNLGNDGNRQRLVDGMGWSEAKVMAALEKHMTADEWLWVQGVWDSLATLYPHIEKVHIADQGLRPAEVEAVSFKVTTAEGYEMELRGGYFPARYDPRVPAKGNVSERQEAATVEAMQGPNYRKPKVLTTHAQKRAQEFEAVVNLDFGLVPAHVSQVIHDVTHRLYVKEAASVVLHPDFKTLVRGRMGPEYEKQFPAWLMAVASSNADSAAAAMGTMNAVLSWSKSRATMAAVGANIATPLADLTNPLLPLMAGEVSARHLARVTAKLGRNWNEFRTFALENSPELRARLKHGNSLGLDIGKMLDHSFSHDIEKYAYAMMEASDRATSTPVWLAKYYQLIEKGVPHAEAVRDSDALVRKYFPSSDQASKANLLRDKGFWGSVTFLAGFANKLYNVNRRTITNAADAWREPGATKMDKAEAIGTAMFVLVGQAAVLGVAGDFMSGRGPKKKDDDAKGVAKWAGERVLATIPYQLGPLASAFNPGGRGGLPAGSLLGKLLTEGKSAFFEDGRTSLDPRHHGPAEILGALGAGLVFQGAGLNQLTKTGRYIDRNMSRDWRAGRYRSIPSGLIFGDKAQTESDNLINWGE